jgi:hypothetical protein
VNIPGIEKVPFKACVMNKEIMEKLEMIKKVH